jgi:predicted phosphoribosyltransferase
VVRNEDIIHALAVDESSFARIADDERATVAERDRSYRGERDRPDVAGKTVIVVDDGLATGATMRAALQALRVEGAACLIAAAPLAPDDVFALLRDVADRIEIVATPPNFVAVGAWYDDFRQVSDEAVRELLQR